VKNLPHNLLGVYADNLNPSSIDRFGDLYVKLVTRFNTSISAKKSSAELFGVTKQKDEFIRSYLKRFDEEMLKVKEFPESVAIKVLIRGVREYAL
jgi:hypothetical protein